MARGLPERVRLNAWCGGPVEGPLETSAKWGSGGTPASFVLAPAQEGERADWWHPEVGWGVVLREPGDPTMPAADKANAVDAAKPIRDLIAERHGVVLRYRPDLPPNLLMRHFADGRKSKSVSLSSGWGIADDRVPGYLLIVGGPEVVPWAVQYTLNRSQRCVGRLDLDDAGLRNYVGALQRDWRDDEASSQAAVVWAVDLGDDDITHEMRVTIAARIAKALRGEAEIRADHLELRPADATVNHLVDVLTSDRPSLVVTTSHGLTEPLDQPEVLSARLGNPVDQTGAMVTAEALAAWKPGGAIWYAQACCSAGSDAGTRYEGLFGRDSTPDRVTARIGALGAKTAPLARALLGRPNPLRAFVGHVEPTFDWTLREASTQQQLTGGLVEAMYPTLYRRKPLGLALLPYYAPLALLHGSWADSERRLQDGHPGEWVPTTRYRLTALDRESLVILGDPTVCLPPLPSQR